MVGYQPPECAGADVQLVYAAGNATGQALALDDFYSNELVKNYYKNHVSFIMNHVNKYTGLQFKVQLSSIQSPADLQAFCSTCRMVAPFEIAWLP